MKVLLRTLLLAVSLFAPTSLFGQTLYNLSFGSSPIPNVPISSSILVTVYISWNGIGAPTNLLNSAGINAGSLALRIATGTGGEVQLTNRAAPTAADMFPVDTSNLTGFNNFNPLFDLFAYNDLGISTVGGHNNLGAIGLSRNDTAGVIVSPATPGVLLPLATFRLVGITPGNVTIQAGLMDLEPLSSDNSWSYGGTDLGNPFGNAIAFGDSNSFLVTSVPEPTTWALIILSFASGIAGIVWYRRRQVQLANTQLQLAEEGLAEVE